METHIQTVHAHQGIKNIKNTQNDISLVDLPLRKRNIQLENQPLKSFSYKRIDMLEDSTLIRHIQTR